MTRQLRQPRLEVLDVGALNGLGRPPMEAHRVRHRDRRLDSVADQSVGETPIARHVGCLDDPCVGRLFKIVQAGDGRPTHERRRDGHGELLAQDGAAAMSSAVGADSRPTRLRTTPRTDVGTAGWILSAEVCDRPSSRARNRSSGAAAPRGRLVSAGR